MRNEDVYLLRFLFFFLRWSTIVNKDTGLGWQKTNTSFFSFSSASFFSFASRYGFVTSVHDNVSEVKERKEPLPSLS